MAKRQNPPPPMSPLSIVSRPTKRIQSPLEELAKFPWISLCLMANTVSETSELPTTSPNAAARNTWASLEPGLRQHTLPEDSLLPAIASLQPHNLTVASNNKKNLCCRCRCSSSNHAHFYVLAHAHTNKFSCLPCCIIIVNCVAQNNWQN